MDRLPVDQPRIIGVETEYGIYPGKDYINRLIFNEAMPDFLHSTHDGFNEYGRIYPDLGVQIEACTPEVTTINGLLAAHFAGEALVQEIATNLFQKANSPKKAVKRSLDSENNSRGEHENYLVGIDFALKDGARLATHLATRLVVSGPGMVRLKPDDTYDYTIDQRGLVTKDIQAISSTGVKPFIKDTEQSFDSSRQTRRLQIVSGSHNMFAYPVAARLFNTSSVIRLIEANKYPDKLTLDSPVRSVRQIAEDDTLLQLHTLTSGANYTAAQIQHSLMESALQLDLPPEERGMAELTAQITGDIIDDNAGKWFGHLEWFAKRKILERHTARASEKFPTADSAVIDIKWHELSPSNVAGKLRSRDMVAMMPAEDAVEAAKLWPPDPTRAQVRTQAIADAAKAGQRMRSVNWGSWQAETDPSLTIIDNAYGY